jgi:predicted kinase
LLGRIAAIENDVLNDHLDSHDNEGKDCNAKTYFTDLVSNGLKLLLEGCLVILDVKFLTGHSRSGIDTNSADHSDAISIFDQSLCEEERLRI